MTILPYIPTGRANALTQHEIAALTGLSPRQVRNQITLLRGQYPICSSTLPSGGYYMAESVEDIDDTLRHMEGRAKKTWEPIVNLKRHKRVLAGQMEYARPIRGAVR